MEKCFDTDRRIRLGIWGLGRGSSFIRAAAAVNIDIVAGCDFSADLREKFRQKCPNAMLTADENEFLAFRDMDAVLVATYFERHAEHAIRALEAGFHVMCEVTSFFTPAEGVRVVEAVERSGKVYNLLENYPFTKENLYLADLWKRGFFGEFQYGEFDYLHECRDLCYGYNQSSGCPPVQPGHTAHSWRSWLDFHYYDTHSLGPVMQITGLRPVEVTAFPEAVALPGYLPGSGMSKPCPSLIRMSNGGVMRNLCGATTNDSRTKRLWGTRASAESTGCGLRLRVGASGRGFQTEVEPEWPALGELAESAGHGGGDFWELYYFAREILTGTPAPWNVYAASDVTLAGIMAVRSHEAGGKPMPIPDFRDPAVRDRYRNDDGAMRRPFDPQQIFPAGRDPEKTGDFTALMLRLLRNSTLFRESCDGAAVFGQIKEAADREQVVEKLTQMLTALPELAADREKAEELIALYPECPAAGALRGALTLIAPEFTDAASARAHLTALLEACRTK